MRAVLSAAAALLLAACSDASGPASGLRVETSKSVYPLPGTPTVTVPYSVRNTGSTPVGLANCGDGVAAELQRRSGGTWVTAAPIECPAFAVYAPIVLAPGEAAFGETEVTVAGEYRIRVAVVEAEGSPYAASRGFAVRWLED
ncbi:hypothetical protein SAMN05216486_1247 [bacterium JGI 053]|nr:hypothetical protein SAMN05216486_1247 [bacterium JGI 053]